MKPARSKLRHHVEHAIRESPMLRMPSRGTSLRRARGLQVDQHHSARGFRARNAPHSINVAVPRPVPASTHDSLSETTRTRSPLASLALSSASGALTQVPPSPTDANRVHLRNQSPRQRSKHGAVCHVVCSRHAETAEQVPLDRQGRSTSVTVRIHEFYVLYEVRPTPGYTRL